MIKGLYHLKLFPLERSKFTAGLPVVRTSPDHGTGFDIAGKGIADHTSFTNAIKLGLQVFKLRNNLD